MLGPQLLLVGLTSAPASAASLLLNLEGVFTALPHTAPTIQRSRILCHTSIGIGTSQ